MQSLLLSESCNEKQQPLPCSVKWIQNIRHRRKTKWVFLVSDKAGYFHFAYNINVLDKLWDLPENIFPENIFTIGYSNKSDMSLNKNKNNNKIFYLKVKSKPFKLPTATTLAKKSSMKVVLNNLLKSVYSTPQLESSNHKFY